MSPKQIAELMPPIDLKCMDSRPEDVEVILTMEYDELTALIGCLGYVYSVCDPGVYPILHRSISQIALQAKLIQPTLNKTTAQLSPTP